jgi:Ni2+-binding GTPase involved in maturation of urease and hydrogenase
VVVASPPGAGKTRLVVHLAEQLHRRAGLLVAVAAQTRAQTLDVAERIARAGGAVGLLGTRDGHRPPPLDPRVTYLAGAAQLSHWRGIARGDHGALVVGPRAELHRRYLHRGLFFSP